MFMAAPRFPSHHTCIAPVFSAVQPPRKEQNPGSRFVFEHTDFPPGRFIMMRVNRRKLIEFLYRAGQTSIELDQLEILEALQAVGFTLVGPRFGAEASISEAMLLRALGAKPDRNAHLPGRASAAAIQLLEVVEEPVDIFGIDLLAPTILSAMGRSGVVRVRDFFAAHIDNRHTRRAYSLAIGNFLGSCERAGIKSFAAVGSKFAMAYFDELTRDRSTATAEQRMSAVRRLYDWLVAGRIMWASPIPTTRQIVALRQGPRPTARTA
jgi:hypothetical protein